MNFLRGCLFFLLLDRNKNSNINPEKTEVIVVTNTKNKIQKGKKLNVMFYLKNIKYVYVYYVSDHFSTNDLKHR